MENQQPQSEQEITSPFSSVRASPSRRRRSRRNSSPWVLAGTIGILAILLVTASVVVRNYVEDPYRQLQEFPVGKYFDGFESLNGLRFRASLRVEADLGWKDGVGRLMAFTPIGETRQLVVFIPQKLSDVFFNKGQTYIVALQMKEGGLIYATSCKKD